MMSSSSLELSSGDNISPEDFAESSPGTEEVVSWRRRGRCAEAKWEVDRGLESRNEDWTDSGGQMGFSIPLGIELRSTRHFIRLGGLTLIM